MIYILQLNILPLRRFKAQNFQTGSHEILKKIRHVKSISLRYKINGIKIKKKIFATF